MGLFLPISHPASITSHNSINPRMLMLATQGPSYGISQTNTSRTSPATTLVGLLSNSPKRVSSTLPPAQSVRAVVPARSAIVRLPRPQQNRVGSMGYPFPQQCRLLWSPLSGLRTPPQAQAIVFWPQFFSQKFSLLKKNPRRQKPYCSLPVHASSSVMIPPHPTPWHR